MPVGIIESLDHEARGITRLEGKTVFVEGGLPGERVEYSCYRKKPTYEIARVDRVVERAREILHQLESGEDKGAGRPAALLDDLPLFRAAPAPAPVARAQPSAVEARLRDLNPDTITAREALDLVYELSAMLTDSA